MKTFKVALRVRPIIIAAHNEDEAIAHAWKMVTEGEVAQYVTGSAREV